MTSYLEVCYTALAITLAQYLTYALIHPPSLPDPLECECMHTCVSMCSCL